MASITMCTGKGCAEKNDCYRYRAIPSPVNQRWQQFDPKDTANCFFVTREEHPKQYLMNQGRFSLAQSLVIVGRIC